MESNLSFQGKILVIEQKSFRKKKITYRASLPPPDNIKQTKKKKSIAKHSATEVFEFIGLAFSESLISTYSPVQAILSNKSGKMSFFTVFTETFSSAILKSCSFNPTGACCVVTSNS